MIEAGIHHADGAENEDAPMLGATLTKDQWWFVLTTAVVQAAVTLAAVYFGARWALTREDRSRRRRRADEAAVIIAAALPRLEHVMETAAWLGQSSPILLNADLGVQALVEAYSSHIDVGWNESVFLLDPQLRASVEAARDSAVVLLLMHKHSLQPDDWVRFGAWALKTSEFVAALDRAVGSAVRGEPYEPPVAPPPPDWEWTAYGPAGDRTDTFPAAPPPSPFPYTTPPPPPPPPPPS
jgi:hypothetical protein